MENGEMTLEEYKIFLAKSFWPAFWECWHRNKFGMTWLTIKDSFVQWRDNEADSVWWFLRSFFKGFNFYFLIVLAFCICIAEISFLFTLRKSQLNFGANELVEPLYWALPALIGTTMLDYLLEFRKRPTVAVLAFFLLLALGYFAYSFHVCKPAVNQFYSITLGVIYFAWCIKACDPRMHASNRTSSSVMPGSSFLSESNPSPSILKSKDGKTVILKRPEGGGVK